jgi:hypothetical protein
MALAEYMNDWFTLDRDNTLHLFREFEKRRNLRLIKKIEDNPDEIYFYSWFSEVRFGLFFDKIADVLQNDPKIRCPKSGEDKTPDWLVEVNEQTILTEVLRVSALTEPQLREHIAFVHRINRRNVEHGSIKYFHTTSRGLDSAYYYNCQAALERKEERYRAIIHERKWPFVICLSPMLESFINVRDTYDFFIASGKGFLYTNEYFRENVTGILLKTSFGEFVYFHNENAQYQLNRLNLDVFQSYSYEKQKVA